MKNKYMRLLKISKAALLVIIFFTMSSCVGISADITMRQDGSGRIALQYRFSRMAEALGRLDGNERWPIIPTGRADIERTLARIPGMRLVSFSVREDDRDIINHVELEFNNIETLLTFLDPSGRRASLSRQGGSNRLSVAIMDGTTAPIDANLLDLMRALSVGYNFSLSFSADGNSTLTLLDGNGNAIQASAGTRIISSGSRVSIEMETGEVLEHKQGLTVVLTW